MSTTTDYIEDYLNQQLRSEEQESFNEKLKSDKEFAREVEEHGLLINSFDEMQAQELLLRFNSIEKDLEGGKEKRIGFRPYLKWAATVAAIAIVSLVVYLNVNTSNKELFLVYYAPYPNVESPVSRSEAEGNAVWRHYENGNYKAAYQQFELALVIDEDDMASRFYFGICALELSQLKVAEEAFTIVAGDNGTYSDQAEWYLALSYLKDGKQDATVQALEQIISNDSGYAKKAKSLLVEME